MSVRVRPACVRLVEGVKKYFIEKLITAEVAFGDLALGMQTNQGQGRANRVVLCPFDPKSGNAGQLLEPIQHGWRDVMSVPETPDDKPCVVGQIRALADWERLYIVSAWACDGAAPTDELAQHAAAEQLLEAAVQGTHYAGFANIKRGAVSAVLQGERRFGRELRMEMRFTHPLFDRPQDVGRADVVITKDL